MSRIRQSETNSPNVQLTMNQPPRIFIRITRSTATQSDSTQQLGTSEAILFVGLANHHANSTTPNHDFTDHLLDIYQICDGRNTTTEFNLHGRPTTSTDRPHLQTRRGFTTIANNRIGNRGYDRNQIPVSFDVDDLVDARNDLTTEYAFDLAAVRTVSPLHRVSY